MKTITLVLLDDSLDDVDDRVIAECIRDALHEAATNRDKRAHQEYSKNGETKEFERLRKKHIVLRALQRSGISASNCVASLGIECDCNVCKEMRHWEDRS